MSTNKLFDNNNVIHVYPEMKKHLGLFFQLIHRLPHFKRLEVDTDSKGVRISYTNNKTLELKPTDFFVYLGTPEGLPLSSGGLNQPVEVAIFANPYAYPKELIREVRFDNVVDGILFILSILTPPNQFKELAEKVDAVALECMDADDLIDSILPL